MTLVDTTVSALLGVALALVFYRICADRKCLVISQPSVKDITSITHQFEGDCFKFKAVATACPENKEDIVSAFD